MFMEKVKGVAKELEFKLNSFSPGIRIVIAAIGLLIPYLLPATFLSARRTNYAILSAFIVAINLISTFFWESVPIVGILFGVLVLLTGLMMLILWFMALYYFITVTISKNRY